MNCYRCFFEQARPDSLYCATCGKVMDQLQPQPQSPPQPGDGR